MSHAKLVTELCFTLTSLHVCAEDAVNLFLSFEQYSALLHCSGQVNAFRFPVSHLLHLS